MAEVLHADVLIVGAGPVGLAAAIGSGMRGVRVLLVERNERAGVAPPCAPVSIWRGSKWK